MQTVVGLCSEIPNGSCRIVRVGRGEVGVFNVDGQYYALNNVCAHAGGPVCLGKVSGLVESDGGYQLRWTREGEILRCPWHGWEFEIASGRSVTEPVRTIRSYPLRVEGEELVLDLPD